MSVIREVHTGAWCVRLDLCRQVLRLEAAEYQEAGGPLLRTLPVAEPGPVSAATLLLKAKQFDDGLQAAVELAVQRGAGRFIGKTFLLRSLAAALTADPAAEESSAALILAACELGGLSVAIPPTLRAAVRAVVERFLRDEEGRCKPLGFFTWTPELEAVFRQDRLLQMPLEADTRTALARALDGTPGGWPIYDACLRLATRLTNPLAKPSLREEGDGLAFFPPSTSHEVRLLEKLYKDRPIPEGFDLMAELIRRLRSGKIGLSPTDHSGWYDHQTWSLGPLVVPDSMPESARLDLGKRYRRHLEDLFRGALALARESHAKQGGGGRGGYAGPIRPPILVHPDLTVEPLPSHYRRRAACYRFVQSVLEEAFGADALQRLQRLTPEGPCEVDLAQELDGMQRLFDGAAATASHELGLGSPRENEASVEFFARWRARLAADRDISRDARMMVPVFYDEQRRKTKVWTFLGWRTVSVAVGYRVEPRILAIEAVSSTGESPAQPPSVLFSSDRYEFAVPVMAEVYVEKLLDRDEFRRHCNRFRT